MADNESDFETEGLETALDILCHRHCSNESSLNSKDYCSEFCELVEEYTGQWHVPLPQLKVLRTAFCSFTNATSAFPDDCQHIQHVLSSLALSFFELMLFFSKEEFVEEPLKDILDTFQECHTQLLRHRNIYLQHLKQVIKGGGPWEHPVLQGILKEADLSQNEVEDFLGSDLPIFLELRVRYLQACERMQEAMALAKSCLENQETGKHLYFHQAYLTCLYKSSLYESLQKEMAEIDGRDAVEIICNTESVEKDELLLSLCKAFLTRQLQIGDMYYIWDLVFIWSRLYLRAHPSRQGFQTECLLLASTATNVRAIFPFIKLVTTELGTEGTQVCVELCARALQLCDKQEDAVTQSLVCKTIAFLLPHDLEICRACALLVFCQERNLEAYRIVCLLYMHPDQEPHPHSNPVRTSVRFHILQMLKDRLRFDPEFWNLLTLRTYCLELMSDNVMKDAVLIDMKEEEEKEYFEESLPNNCIKRSCSLGINSCHCNEAVKKEVLEKECVNGAVAPNVGSLNKRSCLRKKLRRKTQILFDDELKRCDDPEFEYNLKSSSLDSTSVYGLRRKYNIVENSSSINVPLNQNREYLSRSVKSQILKRQGRKKRWLQGIPRLELMQTVREKNIRIGGKKRGRKPLPKLELSYPDNEIYLTEESCKEPKTNLREDKNDVLLLETDREHRREEKEENLRKLDNSVKENEGSIDTVCCSDSEIKASDAPQTAAPAVQSNHELNGPSSEFQGYPLELWHNYSLDPKTIDSEKLQTPESQLSDEYNDTDKEESQSEEETEGIKRKVKAAETWRERLIRSQQYAHLTYHCTLCHKTYKGLNVMRHALSHLKHGGLCCIFCEKSFKLFPPAKKHVWEHIEEMRRQKPDKAANGESNPSETNPQDPSQSKDGHEAKIRTRMLNLSREERIFRNVRILLRKTLAGYKKCNEPHAGKSKKFDFKDEQVVITGDTVIVKDVLAQMMAREEDSEMPAGENGGSPDVKYHLCPSENCDKVFLKTNSALTRHAIKCHGTEESVLEKTFIWAKCKCCLCFRQIQYLQHYKDHMTLHHNQLPHICYHVDCKQRFSSQLDLKEHVKAHQPFRPQCPFTNCEKLFSSYPALVDHEWRHYVPAPQKEEPEPSPGKQPSAEAPWKQRVKVEELWLSKKVPRESGDETNAARIQNFSQTLRTSGNSLVKTSSGADREDNEPSSNGCEDATKKVTEKIISISHPAPGATTLSEKAPKKGDEINIRQRNDGFTMTKGIQKKMAESHITEHTSFKPEDGTSSSYSKAIFIRPPPSAYLDESLLSMRKRRSTDSPAESPKKFAYYTNKNKEAVVAVMKRQDEAVKPEQKIRHRCEKCLSSFGSLVELQTHQAQNTCSSLFGFDSDDDN